MNYVFMIMCHKNISQVKRMIRTIVTDRTYVVVHADSCVNDVDFMELKDFSNNFEHVYLTENRLHGELYKRSLVDIVFEMLKTVRNIEASVHIHFSYYALLSGQDYLIKPMKFIEEELHKCYPVPLIDCLKYDRKNWIFHKFDVNERILLLRDWIRCNIPSRICKIFQSVTFLYRKFERLLKRTSYYFFVKNKIDLYGGSAWWILPDIVIDFIEKEVEEEKTYLSVILNESYTPDETFFQILSMRSPLKEKIYVRTVTEDDANMTWAYFSDEDSGKPFYGHPYIFTEAEFEKIKKSKKWIARKFDETVDKEILNKIDKEILLKL